MNVQIEQFSYDDAIVRKFTLMTLVWGVVGMLVGVIVALQLAAPFFNFELPWLSFGRLRPLHTNAVIFAFAGNAIFAGIYYSMQRLLKTAMFSKALGAIHFWGWQAIIVAAAVTLPLGITQGKEYAELQWPIDIAIAVIWVIFAINAFCTMNVTSTLRSGSTSPPSSPLPSSTSSTTWWCRPGCGAAIRSTPGSRTPSCSGGTATTQSASF